MFTSSVDMQGAFTKKKTQYGQTKLNFGGPVYNSSRGAGHTERMVGNKEYLDFSL